MSRPLRDAVAQYEPRVGELEHNLSQAVLWATAAADRGTQLIEAYRATAGRAAPATGVRA